jgi:hypothetical protein
MTWRHLIARAWRIFWRWYWRPRRLAKIERLEIALGMRGEEAKRALVMPTWNSYLHEMQSAVVEVYPHNFPEIRPGAVMEILPPNPPPFVLAAMVDHDEMERQHKTAREVRALHRIADANRRLRVSGEKR